MSISNLVLRYISYNDANASNNPKIRVADVAYDKSGQKINKSKVEDLQIGPSDTLSIFNGSRSTSMDNTTAFTITRPDPNLNKYRLTHSSGTPPAFRTAVSLGIDGTTVVSVTVNGPLMKIANVSGTPMVTTSLNVGDVLNILPGSGLIQSNQGRFTVLAKDANSITVENLNAAPQPNATLVPSDFLTYNNGVSTNKVQINDKMVISAGLSEASWGTYQVTEVTPNWIEFLAAENKGLPLETDIIIGNQGLKFYSNGKMFLLVAAQQKCSVRCNGDISDNVLLEPEEPNNQEKPALLIKDGLLYSLEIKNLSLETLNVIVITSE